MDTPPISLWVQLKKVTPHWSTYICFVFSWKVFYFESSSLNLFLSSQVMNGLIISHNVKDHNNGSAPLRSLPVITLNSQFSILNRHGSRWTWGNLLFDLFSRFQHWSRTVFCRPWQPEGTSLILQVRQTYSDATSPLSHILFPQESLSVS